MKNETNKQTNKTTLTNRPLDKREQKKHNGWKDCLFCTSERERKIQSFRAFLTQPSSGNPSSWLLKIFKSNFPFCV